MEYKLEYNDIKSKGLARETALEESNLMSKSNIEEANLQSYVESEITYLKKLGESLGNTKKDLYNILNQPDKIMKTNKKSYIGSSNEQYRDYYLFDSKDPEVKAQSLKIKGINT